MSCDPLRVANAWLAMARREGVPKADAFCLCTVTSEGYPTARMMMAGSLNSTGIAFFTDDSSPKVSDLSINSRAAAVFYWHQIGRQVRIEGEVQQLEEHMADADFDGKSVSQRAGIHLWQQSSPRGPFRGLSRKVSVAVAENHEGFDSRPDRWKGFMLIARRVELFRSAAERLNRRIRFDRQDGASWLAIALHP